MKIPKKYDEAVPLETLADGYCKSIKNAIRIIEDGEILKNSRRYLTALNCFRLALEELAKAHLINQAVMFDESDKDKWAWFWDAFESHKEKTRLLEYELHWEGYQDREEFHRRVTKLMKQREESLYVQFDPQNEAFLKPEDFFESPDKLASYVQIDFEYTKRVLARFLLAGEPTPDIMLKVFQLQKSSVR